MAAKLLSQLLVSFDVVKWTVSASDWQHKSADRKSESDLFVEVSEDGSKWLLMRPTVDLARIARSNGYWVAVNDSRLFLIRWNH